MAWRLRTYDTNPPGGFLYEQKEGIYKKFKSNSSITALAREVAEFRRANNVPRGTFEEALEDIDFYNCQRLGFSLRYCYNTDKSFAATTPQVQKPRGCGGCGAHVK